MTTNPARPQRSAGVHVMTDARRLVHLAELGHDLLPANRLAYADRPICGQYAVTWRLARSVPPWIPRCRRCAMVLQRRRAARLEEILARSREQLDRDELLELIRRWTDPATTGRLRQALLQFSLLSQHTPHAGAFAGCEFRLGVRKHRNPLPPPRPRRWSRVDRCWLYEGIDYDAPRRRSA